MLPSVPELHSREATPPLGREHLLLSWPAFPRWMNGDTAGTRDELVSEVASFGTGDTSVP